MSHNNNLFIDEREVDALKSGFEIDMMIQYSIENPHLSFDEIQRVFDNRGTSGETTADQQIASVTSINPENDEQQELQKISALKQKKVNVLKNIVNAFFSFFLRFERKRSRCLKMTRKLQNLKQNKNEIKYFLETPSELNEKTNSECSQHQSSSPQSPNQDDISSPASSHHIKAIKQEQQWSDEKIKEDAAESNLSKLLITRGFRNDCKIESPCLSSEQNSTQYGCHSAINQNYPQQKFISRESIAKYDQYTHFLSAPTIGSSPAQCSQIQQDSQDQEQYQTHYMHRCNSDQTFLPQYYQQNQYYLNNNNFYNPGQITYPSLHHNHPSSNFSKSLSQTHQEAQQQQNNFGITQQAYQSQHQNYDQFQQQYPQPWQRVQYQRQTNQQQPYCNQPYQDVLFNESGDQHLQIQDFPQFQQQQQYLQNYPSKIKQYPQHSQSSIQQNVPLGQFSFCNETAEYNSNNNNSYEPLNSYINEPLISFPNESNKPMISEEDRAKSTSLEISVSSIPLYPPSFSSQQQKQQPNTNSLMQRHEIEETLIEIFRNNSPQEKQSKASLQNLLANFKRFTKEKIVNKSNLNRLLNSHLHNKLFEYFLVNFSTIWLESCLVQDKIIHQIGIQFLLKCCHQPSLINSFYVQNKDKEI